MTIDPPSGGNTNPQVPSGNPPVNQNPFGDPFGSPYGTNMPTGININYIERYSGDIIGIINELVLPVLMAIAFIVFIWGVYTHFIAGANEPKKLEDGRQFILWGIIGFVVIFSIWGLVAIVGDTFMLSPGGMAPPYPVL